MAKMLQILRKTLSYTHLFQQHLPDMVHVHITILRKIDCKPELLALETIHPTL